MQYSTLLLNFKDRISRSKDPSKSILYGSKTYWWKN